MSKLNISDFQAKLTGGGARSNLFEVTMTPPDGTSGKIKVAWNNDPFTFLCKSAALPASNIGSIPLNIRGRVFQVYGDRTFDPWTVTIINDTDFKYRTYLEDWINKINQATTQAGDPAWLDQAEDQPRARCLGSYLQGSEFGYRIQPRSSLAPQSES